MSQRPFLLFFFFLFFFVGGSAVSQPVMDRRGRRLYFVDLAGRDRLEFDE